jgi:hypothetical protein
VNRAFVAAVAVAALVGARAVRIVAAGERPDDGTDAPYAPTPTSAPFVTLGYRELGADVLFVRMVGYFGGNDSDANAIASLADAITTLDPTFRKAYEFGAVATTGARHGVDNDSRLRAIALLRKAMTVYPHSYRYPMLAGQIYLADLATKDPAQRRAWDEQGSLLLESASRKPNAPAEAALTAASLQTRFGQRERAASSLRELLLITTDEGARKQLVERLAELEHQDAEAIAAELFEARRTFEHAWRRDRPAVPATIYVLVGPRPAPGFDLGDLATGGRDLIGTATVERLDPPSDP